MRADSFDMSQMRAALNVPVDSPPPHCALPPSFATGSSNNSAYASLAALAPNPHTYTAANSARADHIAAQMMLARAPDSRATVAARIANSPNTHDLQQALVGAMKNTLRLAPDTPLYATVPGWTHRRALSSLWRELEVAARALAPPHRSTDSLEAAVCVLMAGALYTRGELKTACAAVRACARSSDPAFA
jgi:hypothetical protein